MGYSTNLYLIDIALLQSAIGSGDSKLVQRARRAKTPRVSEADKVHSENHVRVKYGLNGELYLGNEQVTIENLIVVLQEVGQLGVLVEFNEPHPKNYLPSAQKKIREQVLDATRAAQLCRFLSCDTEAEYPRKIWNEENDDDRDEKAACKELIKGKPGTLPAHVYGYAFERICCALGTLVKKTDLGNLTDLQLASPLAKHRLPVAFPKEDDFPYISYLTTSEVAEEIARLTPILNAKAGNTELYDEQYRLLKALKLATEKQLGIIAFYY